MSRSFESLVVCLTVFFFFDVGPYNLTLESSSFKKLLELSSSRPQLSEILVVKESFENSKVKDNTLRYYLEESLYKPTKFPLKEFFFLSLLLLTYSLIVIDRVFDLVSLLTYFVVWSQRGPPKIFITKLKVQNCQGSLKKFNTSIIRFEGLPMQ